MRTDRLTLVQQAQEVLQDMERRHDRLVQTLWDARGNVKRLEREVHGSDQRLENARHELAWVRGGHTNAPPPREKP